MILACGLSWQEAALYGVIAVCVTVFLIAGIYIGVRYESK